MAAATASPAAAAPTATSLTARAAGRRDGAARPRASAAIGRVIAVTRIDRGPGTGGCAGKTARARDGSIGRRIRPVSRGAAWDGRDGGNGPGRRPPPSRNRPAAARYDAARGRDRRPERAPRRRVGSPQRRAHPETVMTPATDRLDQLAVNTIRTLAIDGVQQANSGHPGAP